MTFNVLISLCSRREPPESGQGTALLLYLSHFVSICIIFFPIDRDVVGVGKQGRGLKNRHFWGMFNKLNLCKNLLLEIANNSNFQKAYLGLTFTIKIYLFIFFFFYDFVKKILISEGG